MLNRKYLKRKLVLVSLIGCIVLIVANFLPIVQISSDLLEYTNIFRFASYEGKYIIFAAVIAFLLLLFEEPKYASLPMLVITIILGYLLMNRSELSHDCSVFEEMLSWGPGLYALIVGAVLAWITPVLELVKGAKAIIRKKRNK